jgi:hypothetical protein
VILPELHDSLVRAGEAQEGTSRRRRRFGKRRTLVASLAALMLCGTAAAAVLSVTGSRPLTGTVSPGPNGGRSHYTIRVFPMMTVGWSGWCTAAEFSAEPSKRTTAYGCNAVEGPGPLIAGGDEFGNAHSSYTFGIVRSDVAFVRLPDKSLVATIVDPDLPVGARAYFSLTRVRDRSPDEPRSVAYLDAAGKPIATGSWTPATAVTRLPVAAARGDAALSGVCQIRARPFSGLTLITETVTQLRAWPRFQGGTFLACANATFRLGMTTLGLAVLADATAPARPAPELPGLRPDRHRPGLLVGTEVGNIGFPAGFSTADFGGEAPFQAAPTARIYASRDITARRAGSVWLVAEGGTESQRALLLAHADAHVPRLGA